MSKLRTNYLSTLFLVTVLGNTELLGMQRKRVASLGFRVVWRWPSKWKNHDR